MEIREIMYHLKARYGKRKVGNLYDGDDIIQEILEKVYKEAEKSIDFFNNMEVGGLYHIGDQVVASLFRYSNQDKRKFFQTDCYGDISDETGEAIEGVADIYFSSVDMGRVSQERVLFLAEINTLLENFLPTLEREKEKIFLKELLSPSDWVKEEHLKRQDECKKLKSDGDFIKPYTLLRILGYADSVWRKLKEKIESYLSFFGYDSAIFC